MFHWVKPQYLKYVIILRYGGIYVSILRYLSCPNILLWRIFNLLSFPCWLAHPFVHLLHCTTLNTASYSFHNFLYNMSFSILRLFSAMVKLLISRLTLPFHRQLVAITHLILYLFQSACGSLILYQIVALLISLCHKKWFVVIFP